MQGDATQVMFVGVYTQLDIAISCKKKYPQKKTTVHQMTTQQILSEIPMFVG